MHIDWTGPAPCFGVRGRLQEAFILRFYFLLAPSRFFADQFLVVFSPFFSILQHHAQAILSVHEGPGSPADLPAMLTFPQMINHPSLSQTDKKKTVPGVRSYEQGPPQLGACAGPFVPVPLCTSSSERPASGSVCLGTGCQAVSQESRCMHALSTRVGFSCCHPVYG